VTDVGLKSLESLKNLSDLTLDDTEATIDGAAALQRALPDCRIHWNDNARVMQEGSTDRRTAAWVVARGGEVVMSGPGLKDEFKVHALNELPAVASGNKILKVSLLNERLRSYDYDLGHFSQLSELQSLNLFRAGPFTAAGMVHLANLKSLKSLDLSSPIGDGGLEHLKGLTNLEWLTLSACEITDAGLMRLAGMKNLKTLQIGDNNITDEGAAVLATLPKLYNLDLQRTWISDRGLDSLLSLPELTLLSLAHTRVTDAGLKALGAKTQLQRLSLEDLPISDEALISLESLRKLRSLTLRGTNVTAEGVTRLQKALPDCKIDWAP